MLKIAFDHQIFISQSYGGVSRYYTILSRELERLGYRPHVFAGIHRNNYLSILPAGIRSGVTLKRYPPKAERIIRWLSRCMVSFQMAMWQPNIVHETYYSAKGIAPKKAKTVITVYDMIHEIFSDQFPRANQLSSRKAAAVSRADHVICISEQTKRDLIEFLDVDPRKISVIYLGFELPVDTASTQTVDFKRPYLLYVGDRRGYKNFSCLLAAYAKSNFLRSNYDLVCFGGGGFTVEERELFQDLSVSFSQIHHIAGDDNALVGCYKSAAVFVYPSLYEGFGIPPLEAMSFDCPVVCSNTSSIPEVVGGAARLFDPANPDSIREAIEAVLLDNDLKQELINSGRDRIKHFSWARCARETLQVYQGLLR